MIVGRSEEIAKLKRAYESEYSEFVAVYGRRRIGKTFLVRETFCDNFTFEYTGAFKVTTKEQIREFHRALLLQGLDPKAEAPKNWFDAFYLLGRLIDGSKAERKVVFIDELPWMDASNSRFLPAFEHFWNGWASARKDILLIVCGSATSWIINKILRNRGGLYNRVTYRIRLNQFSLHECEQLAVHNHLPFSRNMILEGYMAMGGVPYYWTKLSPAKSLAQNINDLFFDPSGELHDEFSYIYSSMFRNPEKYIKVIEALCGKKSGLTREEIIQKGKLDTNGRLSTILEDLIECGFVRKYCHTDRKVKDAIYQLIDCYSLFYYQFLCNAHGVDEQYWQRLMRTPAYNTWCGLSFERVCLLHSRQIKQALGISGIMANLFSWHIGATDEHPGVQIDLLIDRADNIVDICEMKYAPDGYELTASSLAALKRKRGVLQRYMPSKKYVEIVLVTSNGVVRNAYSDEIPSQVTADQLFEP